MNFNEELKTRVEQIEQVIRRFLPKEEGFQKTVIEAMNYSMLAGGKRLRPMFMKEFYDIFGGNDDTIEYFMAAQEMIHTYSLVHDDLPAMDNDEYRRGRKTTHIVYGEAMGILAGDGLLNYAYETAAKAFSICEDPMKVAKAMQILTTKAGIYGMIGGQCTDIESEGQAIGLDQLTFIHQLKTGALLESSCMIGAALAGADEEQLALVESIAADVGMAFQIQDDILDVTGTQEQLGKPIHSDEKNEKMTYVNLKGLAQAKADVEALSAQAVEKIQQLPGHTEFLEELVKSLINRVK